MILRIATAFSALLLAGCAGRGPVDTSCTAFTTITYSASQDSEATKAQIRGHNAAYGKLCR
mgnify:FL=1|jgi:outer membrane murein-binding lipoprotein Lpp